MKSIILVACVLLTIAVAAPVEPEPPTVIRSDFEHKPDGGYSYSYETKDGVVREETGELKEVYDEEKKPHLVIVVRGLYKFPKEDGHFESINYQADENGYQATGDSIPTAPTRR